MVNLEYFNLIQIYEQISWLWDVFILGFLLSELFSVSNEKIHLSRNNRMPYILGFFISTGTVYWLQKQGLTLFSLIPQILIPLILLGGVLLWHSLHSRFGQKNKYIPIILAVFTTIFLLGLLAPLLDFFPILEPLISLIFFIAHIALLVLVFWAVGSLVHALWTGGRSKHVQQHYENDLSTLEKRLSEGFEQTKEYISQQLEPIKLAIKDLHNIVNSILDFVKGIVDQLKNVEEHQNNILEHLQTVAKDVNKTGELSLSLASDVGAMRTNYDELSLWLKDHTGLVIEKLDSFQENIQEINTRSKQLHEEQIELLSEFKGLDKKLAKKEEQLTDFIQNAATKAHLDTLKEDIKSHFETLNANIDALKTAEKETQTKIEVLQKRNISVRKDMIKRVVEETMQKMKTASESLEHVQRSGGQEKEQALIVIRQAQGSILNLQQGITSLGSTLQEVGTDLQTTYRTNEDVNHGLNSMAKIMEEIKILLEKINKKTDQYYQDYKKADEIEKATSAEASKAVKNVLQDLKIEKELLTSVTPAHKIIASLYNNLNKSKNQKEETLKAIDDLKSLVKHIQPERTLTLPVIKNPNDKKILSKNKKADLVINSIEAYKAEKTEYFKQLTNKINEVIAGLEAFLKQSPVKWKQEVMPYISPYMQTFYQINKFQENVQDLINMLRAL